MGKDGPRPRIVCCAIPISRAASKVLLITSRKQPSQWILPKGGWETHDPSLEAAACREALEEAGVHGPITRFVIKTESTAAMIHFFELDVTSLEEKWLESGERNREWVDYGEALRRLTWKPELLAGLKLCSLAPKR